MILKSAPPSVALSNQAPQPEQSTNATQLPGGPRTSNSSVTRKTPRRVPIIELNEHLTCSLCKGYYVDATTIIECLHSFCRSCIVTYLASNKYCPVCDVQVHKTKPLLNIRPDKTLQDIVYKLVPKLFQDEMQSRREFYANHPDTKPSTLEQRGEASYQHLLTSDETLCISLIYHGASEQSTPRYLRCPAAVSVSHLQKLIRAKYDLNDNHRVDILHNQDCLNAYLTLMDIAYIYLWRRKGPLALTYRIYENTSRKLADDDAANENNNNETYEEGWKEVQLRISENGEMSVTGIQDCLSLLDDNILKDESEEKESEEAIQKSKGEKTTLKKVEKTKLKSKKDEATTQRETRSTQLKHCEEKLITKPEIKVTDAKGKGIKVLDVKIHRKRKASEDVVKTGEKAELPSKKAKKSSASEGEKAEAAVKPSAVLVNHTFGSGLQNLSNNHPLKKHSLATTTTSTNSNKNLSDQADQIKLMSQIGSQLSIVKVKPSNKHKQLKPNTVAPINSTHLTSSGSVTVTLSTVSSAATTATNTTFSTPIMPAPAPLQSPHYAAHINRVYTPPPLPSYTPINVPSVQKLNNAAAPVAPTSPTVPIGKPKQTQNYKTLRDPPKTWNPQLPRPEPKTTNDLRNIRPAKFFKMRNNMPRYLGNPASGVKPMYHVQVQGASPDKDANKDKDKDKDKTNKKDPSPEASQHKKSPSSSSSTTEIKRHSVVKIDPKTLKPIMERAPDMTSLSISSSFNHQGQGATGNQKSATAPSSDLKINTSSVSIFNPLKLQQQSERKSPHSPNIAGSKSRTSSSPTPHAVGQARTTLSPSTSSPHMVGVPSNVVPLMPAGLSPSSSLKHQHQQQHQQKANLSFTASNPFVPNLQSPTLSPNQFMYPQQPGGFPSYDPMMMAAYQSLLAYQRMPFNYDLHKLQQMGGYPLGVGGLMQNQMHQMQKSPGPPPVQLQQPPMMQSPDDRRKSPNGGTPPAKKPKVDHGKEKAAKEKMMKEDKDKETDKPETNDNRTKVAQVLAKESKSTNVKTAKTSSSSNKQNKTTALTTTSTTIMPKVLETNFQSKASEEKETGQEQRKELREDNQLSTGTPVKIVEDKTEVQTTKDEPKVANETKPAEENENSSNSQKLLTPLGSSSTEQNIETKIDIVENEIQSEKKDETSTSTTENLIGTPTVLPPTVNANKSGTCKTEKTLQNALDKLTKAKMNEKHEHKDTVSPSLSLSLPAVDVEKQDDNKLMISPPNDKPDQPEINESKVEESKTSQVAPVQAPPLEAEITKDSETTSTPKDEETKSEEVPLTSPNLTDKETSEQEITINNKVTVTDDNGSMAKSETVETNEDNNETCKDNNHTATSTLSTSTENDVANEKQNHNVETIKTSDPVEVGNEKV